MKMTTHPPDGLIAHAILSIFKFVLLIVLSPIFLLLAVFYMILHANRAPCQVLPAPEGNSAILSRG